MALKVGIIGYGEVGSIFARALVENKVQVSVYDVLFYQGEKQEQEKARAQEEKLHVDSLHNVIDNSEYILSTVTTQVAKEVARECKSHLKAGQIYIDLNSTSPYVKKEVDEIIKTSGADFVEGAILGAVGATGAKTKILTGGSRGEKVANQLSEAGLNVKFYHDIIGKASMFKMLRSIFSKGVEAILIELLVSGKKAGIEEDLWNVINELMTKNDFDVVASNWIRTHGTACERRYFELKQVVETMNDLGIDPLMTATTEQFFKRAVSLGIDRKFVGGVDSKEAVIDYYLERLDSLRI